MATTRDYTDYLNDQVDIAPANSQEELDAAELIESLFAQHGLETQLQEFESPALAGLSSNIYLVILFIGIVLAGFIGTVVSLVGLAITALAFVLILLSRRGTDALASIGPSARSQNVIGIHRATGPNVIKGNRPIVIIAHYDTPRENFFNGPQLAKWQPLIKRLSWPLSIVVVVMALLQLPPFIPALVRHVFWVLGVICALPLLLQGAAAIYERFATCTTGASDNKASVAAMLGVLDMVRPGPDDAKEWARNNPRGVRKKLEEEIDYEEEEWDESSEDFEEDYEGEDIAQEYDGAYGDEGAYGEQYGEYEQEPEQDAAWEEEPSDEQPAAAEAYEDDVDAAGEEEYYGDVYYGGADTYDEDEPLAETDDGYELEEPEGIRRGAALLSSLQILPEDCEIEYVDLAPRAEVIARLEAEESGLYEGEEGAAEGGLGRARDMADGALSTLRTGAGGIWERIKQIFAELVERFRRHEDEAAGDVDEDDVEELAYGEEWGLVPEDEDESWDDDTFSDDGEYEPAEGIEVEIVPEAEEAADDFEDVDNDGDEYAPAGAYDYEPVAPAPLEPEAVTEDSIPDVVSAASVAPEEPVASVTAEASEANLGSTGKMRVPLVEDVPSLHDFGFSVETAPVDVARLLTMQLLTMQLLTMQLLTMQLLTMQLPMT